MCKKITEPNIPNSITCLATKHYVYSHVLSFVIFSVIIVKVELHSTLNLMDWQISVPPKITVGTPLRLNRQFSTIIEMVHVVWLYSTLRLDSRNFWTLASVLMPLDPNSLWPSDVCEMVDILFRPQCAQTHFCTFSCTHISRVSCQKVPTRHADAWQIGTFCRIPLIWVVSNCGLGSLAYFHNLKYSVGL